MGEHRAQECAREDRRGGRGCWMGTGHGGQCGCRAGRVCEGLCSRRLQASTPTLPTPDGRENAGAERRKVGRAGGLQAWGAWAAGGLSTKAEWPRGPQGSGREVKGGGQEGRGSGQGGPPVHRKGLGAGVSRRLGAGPALCPAPRGTAWLGREGEGGLLGPGPPLSRREQPDVSCGHALGTGPPGSN